MNDTYRGFLAQLDADFQSKQGEWTEEKVGLEDQLGKLQSVAHMSRWLMRKVLRKMRLSRGIGLATLVFYAWGKQIARRRAARHARVACNQYHAQATRALVQLCFQAFVAVLTNVKVGCKLVQVQHSDRVRYSPQDCAIRAQIFALWRIGAQVSGLAFGGPADLTELDEDEPPRFANIEVAPKEANSVFLRRQVVQGWKKLVKRRQARLAYLRAQARPCVAFDLRPGLGEERGLFDLSQFRPVEEHDWEQPVPDCATCQGAGTLFHQTCKVCGGTGRQVTAAEEPYDDEVAGLPWEDPLGEGDLQWSPACPLAGGDYRLDLCFTHWRYVVVRSISMWRAAYRLVEFRERGLLGKTFSLWNRTVWMAQSQSYWKGELDRSVAQIEEQRSAWEERVEELEQELGRYLPHFGSRVPSREAKAGATWESFLGGIDSPRRDDKVLRRANSGSSRVAR